MTAEMWLIAVVRLLGALPVLRWPFYGGVFALVVDQVDLFIMNIVDLGGVKGYQRFDKILDQAYLLTFLIVALRWQGYERGVAAGLYAFRFTGFVAFEITKSRGLLLWFPNLFEFWFVFVAARHQFKLDRRFTAPTLGVCVAMLFAIKVFQEYAIHHARWLDGFTAVEAVESIWAWVTPF
jgi:hypothetical protein